MNDSLRRPGMVGPRYSQIRSIFFPIYGWQQLFLVASLAIVTALIAASGHAKLAEYMFIGGFIGYGIAVFPSSPATLEIDRRLLPQAISLLRRSRLRPDRSELVWSPPMGFPRYWNTDVLRIQETKGDHVTFKGRLHDIRLVHKELSRLSTSQPHHTD